MNRPLSQPHPNRLRPLALLAAIGALSSWSAAAQVPLDTELVINGTFETGDTSSWAGSSNAAAQPYGTAGVPFSLSAPISGGFWFLKTTGAAGALEQTVDVTGNAADIDAGLLAASLTANAGGIGGDPSRGVLEVDFINAAGSTLGTASVGQNVSQQTRNLETALLERSAVAPVPSGTRELRIRARLTNTTALLDNASVQLTMVQAPTPAPYDVDLLVNGDFETGSISGQPQDGWEVTAAPLTVQPYGTVNTPPFAFSQVISGGTFLLRTDSSDGRSLRQSIDLSANAADVDGGALALTVGAHIGGFAADVASSVMSYRFIGALGQVFLEGQLPVSQRVERLNETVLLREETTVSVPPLTRRIEVSIRFTTFSGASTSRGLVDNVTAVLHAPSITPAAPYDTELLPQGGFESGDHRAFNDASRWRNVAGENIRTVPYGSFGTPNAGDASAWSGGSFVGQTFTRTGRSSYLLDIASNASDVDSGGVRLVLRGDFGAVGTQTDFSSLTARPINAFGQVMDTFVIGEVTPQERGNLTTLLHREGAFIVPPGTRELEFEILLFEPGFSSNSTALIDNVSAVLTLGPPTVVLGTAFCSPAVVNSSGMPAHLSAAGSPFVADNAVTLSVDALPPNTFGLFINSTTTGNTPMAGGSQGTLCLAGSIGRYTGPGQIQSSGPSGQFTLALDLTNHPTPTGFISVTTGQTWSFQAWFRDGNPMPTSNFSNAVAIEF